MRLLLAGAAALALAAGSAHADPGKGNGNPKAAEQRGPSKADRGKADRSDRRADIHDNRGWADAVDRPTGPGVMKDRAPRENRRAKDKNAERHVGAALEKRIDRNALARETTGPRLRNIERVRFDRDRAFLTRDRNRSAIAGCPPGLAKKGNGCQPPGQAKKSTYRNDRWNGYKYRPGLFGLTNYAPGSYFYRDGYLLQRGGSGNIAGYIPLLGGALAIGNAWPSTYESYALPDYYVDYYDLGPVSSYRYADNVIYRVDPEDAAITSVAALLTGDEFTIGRPMPSGYDVYNVPYPYRDRYYDTPEAWYRYSDGYVYRIDPKTQFVAAAIDLLV